MTREDAEKGLAKALSRHIGYTSAAYDLTRIFSVVECFKTRTSAYTEEIVEILAAQSTNHAPSPGYLSEVINFASSFGMIEAVSTRESKLTRYAATELGRSVLGCFSVGDDDFRQFFLTDVVLLADADFMVPLMLQIYNCIDVPRLEYFCSFAADLRERRYTWMRLAFPQPVLFERIASKVTWLKRARGGLSPYEVEVPTLNTARHHSTPRLGWLRELRLMDRNRQTLTKFGADTLNAIVGDETYFWIGPSPDAMDSLALSQPVPSANETDLRMRADDVPASDTEIREVARDTAAMMAKAFRDAKLIHADQASLRLPIAYIQYRSYKDRRNYDWRSLLDRVFDDNRDTLNRLSAHKGHVGFYKLSAP